MQEIKKLDEIRDFSSIHQYKMQTILEEERKVEEHVTSAFRAEDEFWPEDVGSRFL
jgi:hypothetical protein